MRAIDGNSLAEKVEQAYKFATGDDRTTLSYVLDLIADMPTVTLRNDCEYCGGEPMRPLDWQYGLDHIFPDYKYCPMCGRKVRGDEMQTD